MTTGAGKHEPLETDPDKLAQLLQIELIQNRARWEQAKARRGNLRALSLFFLFIVIVAAVAAFYWFMSPEHINEIRANSRGASESPAATPK